MDSYGYCYQNPINLVDPDGMAAVPGDDIYVYKDKKTVVVHKGENTPNRLFVQDASANKNTENRKSYNGAYFEQQMIPSSSYSEADYKAQGFMGSSQFDKDRNSYVFHAGDYSDKNMAQRLGTSMGDDYVTLSDLSILMMPRGGKAEVTPKVSTNVQRALKTLDEIKGQGATVTINPTKPNQELNMTIRSGDQKLDLRIESHKLPPKDGGDGVNPTRHMNVDIKGIIFLKKDINH